jgi:hypothetical protein
MKRIITLLCTFVVAIAVSAPVFAQASSQETATPATPAATAQKKKVRHHHPAKKQAASTSATSDTSK